MEDHSTRIAVKLDNLSEAAIDRLQQVIDLPFGTPISEEDGRLLRAHVAAAQVALNTQVKVDAMRMRAARDDKAMARLLELIASKELVVPCDAERGATVGMVSVGAAPALVATAATSTAD